MNAGKPILCIYPRRRGLRVASQATSVTIDASVSVSRRRPDQHNRGDEQDGDGRADRRNDIDETHAYKYHKYPAIHDGYITCGLAKLGDGGRCQIPRYWF